MGLFDDPGAIDWGQLATGMGTPGMGDNFADRFKGGPPLPIPPPMVPPGGAMAAPPPTAMQSPISPEALAASAAARGIPPPAHDLTPPAPPPVRLLGSTFGPNDGGGDVGSALTGKSAGAPLDITSPAQKAGVASEATATKEPLGKFAEALKGVKMPADPVLQKISSPSAPRPTTQIKGGDIVALLQALNAGAGAGAGLKLPSTLGQALGKG